MIMDLSNRTELINQINEIKKISDCRTNSLIDWVLKTIQSKASYSEYDSIHYGIGIISYTHFTSPIRRMSDLLVHLLLKGYDLNIDSYIKFLNDGDLLQNKVENFIRKHNYSIKLNQKLDGLIISLGQTGIQVFIPELTDSFNIHISKLDTSKLEFSDGILSNSNIQYKVFDKIKLNIIKYDFFKPEFEIIR
jgi:ribonuclease R